MSLTWEVWIDDEGREESHPVEAQSASAAAEEFADDCDFDHETNEVVVCVAAPSSDEVATFTLTAEYDRYWSAWEWPSPLERFGNVLGAIVRWLEQEPRRKQMEAEHREWEATSRARAETRVALDAISRIGRVIGAALRARDELRALGFYDQMHERVFEAHLALGKSVSQ
jgi:hypothetical protein